MDGQQSYGGPNVGQPYGGTPGRPNVGQPDGGTPFGGTLGGPNVGQTYGGTPSREPSPYGSASGPGSQPVGRWQPGHGDPYKWDNLPDKPPVGNANAVPPPTQPLTIEGMPQYRGYGGVSGFDSFSIVPPPPPPPPPSGQSPQMNFNNAAALDERECREAMLSFVAEHSCYGSKTAKDHTITKILPSTALDYILETFCEARSSAWKFEPYRGQPIDGPQFGIPPGPWDIACQPDVMFQNHKKFIEVPHTATVMPCRECGSRGFARCYHCHGCGVVRCHTCGGDGRVSRYCQEHKRHVQEHCTVCGGDGRKRCWVCGGDGRVTCRTCDGYCSLKCYLQLEVTFANHKEGYILEGTDMPDHLISNVTGEIIFEQTLFQVWPIQSYPVPQIAQNSVRLVDSHRYKFSNERQLQQRQILRAVPVTEVYAEWKNWKNRYWVYGLNRKVYCPDYPQTCCWGCQIL